MPCHAHTTLTRVHAHHTGHFWRSTLHGLALVGLLRESIRFGPQALRGIFFGMTTLKKNKYGEPSVSPKTMGCTLPKMAAKATPSASSSNGVAHG